MAASLNKILAALSLQHDSQRNELNNAYAEINQLMRSAFEHRATNEAESKRLLNAALDIECDISGDCKALGDLSEEWGIDFEMDR